MNAESNAANGENFANPEDSEKKGFKDYFEIGRNAIMSMFRFVTKSVLYMVITAILLGTSLLFIGSNMAGKSVVSYATSFLSSNVSSYQIDVGVVNARFSKEFWLFGSPEIVFQNTIVKGSLTSMGDMNFKLNVPNGPSGKLSGSVGIQPVFQVGVDNNYEFTGHGISGSFDVIMVDGDAIVENFYMNVNWDMTGVITEK